MAERLSIRSGAETLAVEVVGSGRPLLWAHGLLSSKELSLELLRGVVGSHRVAVFDQRGHGASSGVAARLDDLAADVLAVLDALGWQRAVLGGESMGAAAVLAVVAEAPARVAGLVVDRPAIGPARRPAMAGDARLIRSAGLPAWIDAQLAAAPPAERELLAARYVATWRAQDEASIAAAFEGVATWAQPPPAAFAPSVVRGCAGDPVHPLPLARSLARALGAGLLVSTRLESLDPDRDARAIETAVRRVG